MTLFRPFLIGLALFLAACAEQAPQAVTKAAPVGDFKLGFAVVVAKDAEKGPFSRDATPKEIEDAVHGALVEKFGGLDGKSFYHIAVGVGAYALAEPGIPLLVSPKSALVADVTLWDDKNKRKINAEPETITIVEGLGAGGVFGSGFSMTREEQLRMLSVLLAEKIEAWIKENEQAFFGDAAATGGA